MLQTVRVRRKPPIYVSSTSQPEANGIGGNVDIVFQMSAIGGTADQISMSVQVRL